MRSVASETGSVSCFDQQCSGEQMVRTHSERCTTGMRGERSELDFEVERTLRRVWWLLRSRAIAEVISKYRRAVCKIPR